MILCVLVNIYLISRRNCGLLVLFMFNLLKYFQAFRNAQDMRWRADARLAWDRDDEFAQRHVLFLLNQRNYNRGHNTEYTFIASGLLLDNSRILTSYTPFKDIVHNSGRANSLMVLFVTGFNKTLQVKVGWFVCARHLVPDMPNITFWRHPEHSPVHDLMIFRMDEEIGKGSSSGTIEGIPEFSIDRDFAWRGEGDDQYNALYSTPARWGDTMNKDDLRMCALGYRDKEEIKLNNKLITTVFNQTDSEDDLIIDCEEWLPKDWGIFICIRNVDDFVGVGSSASLFSNGKLFGLGSFAMFRNDTSVLVFTDVRPYINLIENSCGDEEVP